GRCPPGRGTERDMPVLLDANGLLPGRGPAGRGMPGLGLGMPGPAGAEPPPGRSARAATSPAPSGPGTAGAGAGGGGASAGTGLTTPPSPSNPAVGAGAALTVVFFAAVFAGLGAALAAGAASAGNASLSFLTTGASTVDEGDLTNSPSSWSLAMTTLLSMPSSLASSYTRTFATALPHRSGNEETRTAST